MLEFSRKMTIIKVSKGTKPKTITTDRKIMKATVFHDIRKNDKIFLCISSPDPVRIDGSIDMQAAGECAKLKYSVEREIDPQNCTAESIKALVAEMATESGLDLELSQILKSELGL